MLVVVFLLSDFVDVYSIFDSSFCLLLACVRVLMY